MLNVQKVVQRISAIQQRFNRFNASPSTEFAATLDKAEQIYRQQPLAAGNRNDIEKIIKVAAQKYNVDSKLAMAVAVAESGLDTQAVSPAGATGVMQLMPETAKQLGVRNIYDPRENIDGGVRYLKQLLTTFDGDTVKAVAAYNAGPEAVKQNNGVPPYPETRAYVDKVVALSRH
jgi:soluble lytic murein transglycosylase-like protein